MTSIPAAICRISRNNFKRYYPIKKIQKSFFLYFIGFLKYTWNLGLSGLFIGFLKCAWNLEHFKKRDDYPSLIIFEIIDSEKRGYLNF